MSQQAMSMPDLTYGCPLSAASIRWFSTANSRGSNPDQMRPQFLQAGTHTLGIGRQVERSQRADLAVADQPGVGLDSDDRAVEDGDRFAAGPLVRAFDATAVRRDEQKSVRSSSATVSVCGLILAGELYHSGVRKRLVDRAPVVIHLQSFVTRPNIPVVAMPPVKREVSRSACSTKHGFIEKAGVAGILRSPASLRHLRSSTLQNH